MSKRTLHDFWFKEEPNTVPNTNIFTNNTMSVFTGKHICIVVPKYFSSGEVKCVL